MRVLLAIGALGGLAVPCSAADPPAKTDRHGDPLPVGALARLGTVRNRAPIAGFGIEQDGTVVTVGPTAEVRRWHSADDTSDDPIPLPPPPAGAGYPHLSPDGKFVAVSTNEQVIVWETPTDPKAKPKRAAEFALTDARELRFSPDGTRLLVMTGAVRINTIHVCDVKTGKRTDLDWAASRVEGFHFSGDGKRLGVVAETDFHLLDTVTGKPLAQYPTQGRIGFDRFALNRAGDVLVSCVTGAESKSELHFTDPLTGKKIDGLRGPDRSVPCVSFAPDGKTLLLWDDDGVRWWDPAGAKLIRTFEGRSKNWNPVLFSPDGKTVVTHSGHSLLRWNAATGKPLFPEQNLGHDGAVTGVGVSPDGKRVATRGVDGRVCVWDAATGKELCNAPTAWTSAPAIDFSPDGKFVYVAPWDGGVTKLDVLTGKAATTFATDPKRPKQGRTFAVRVSGDGKIVSAMTGASDPGDPGFVTAWDVGTGERNRVTELPVPVFESGDLSAGAVHVSVNDTGARGVYALGGPKKSFLEAGKLRGVNSAHFSDDGRWYVVTRTDAGPVGPVNSAEIISTLNWDVACTIPMTNPGRAALSPDGRTVAVTDGERLEFYSTATSRSLGGHRVPAGEWGRAPFAWYTHVLRFTPDGTKLVTGHEDGTALVWPVPPEPAK
jgi:WD40 repeat protein